MRIHQYTRLPSCTRPFKPRSQLGCHTEGQRAVLALPYGVPDPCPTPPLLWVDRVTVLLCSRHASSEVAGEYPAADAPRQEAGPSGERLSPERHLLLPKVSSTGGLAGCLCLRLGVQSGSRGALLTALTARAAQGTPSSSVPSTDPTTSGEPLCRDCYCQHVASQHGLCLSLWSERDTGQRAPGGARLKRSCAAGAGSHAVLQQPGGSAAGAKGRQRGSAADLAGLTVTPRKVCSAPPCLHDRSLPMQPVLPPLMHR